MSLCNGVYDCCRGTASLKWTKYGEDILPLWVADMDFKAAEPIMQQLQVGVRRTEARSVKIC